MRTPQKRERGFTLIEVMIVVAIVAILAAIAYPSYQEQVARGKRADAKATLLEAAQWVERQYTVSNSYILKGDGTTLDSAALPFTEAPKESAVKTYDIAFATGASAPTTSTYWLLATPKNSMATDKCGTFAIAQTGARRTVTSGAGTFDDCWNR